MKYLNILAKISHFLPFTITSNNISLFDNINSILFTDQFIN